MTLRCSILALVVALVGCATPNNATDTESVALRFTTIEEAEAHFNEVYNTLDMEYERLREERITALAERDSAKRAAALEGNDRQCEEFRQRLLATDSARRATAAHFATQVE